MKERLVPVVPIHTLNDPRLAPYRDMRERELARDGGRFIAEGEHLVRRLLASDFQTESILLAERRAEEIAPLAPSRVPVYVASQELLNGVLGFRFHSGVIACAIRKKPPTLAQVLEHAVAPLTLVICPEIANTENLGTLIRLSAAFGAAAMVLGERSCDPFFRQSVRVSMGTIFSLPIVRCEDLKNDLALLRERFGVQLIATVLDPSAERLQEATRGDRLGLLFGNEAQGLDDQWVSACDRRVTIPMKLGTDSLNVGVAAGIFLHHFTR